MLKKKSPKRICSKHAAVVVSDGVSDLNLQYKLRQLMSAKYYNKLSSLLKLHRYNRYGSRRPKRMYNLYGRRKYR